MSINKDGQRSPLSPIVEEKNPKHPGYERTGDVICAGASLQKTNELFICSETSETACCLHVVLSLLSSLLPVEDMRQTSKEKNILADNKSLYLLLNKYVCALCLLTSAGRPSLAIDRL